METPLSENPYVPPSSGSLDASAEPSAKTYPLANGGTLTLTDDLLQVAEPSRPAVTLSRSMALAESERLLLPKPPHIFVLRRPKRRPVTLDGGGAAALDAWLGPSYAQELRHQLGNRLSLSVPLAVLFLVTSGGEIGSILLGVVLLVGGLLSRFRPRRSVLLFDVAFWLIALLRNGYALALPDSSRTHPTISIVFLVLNLFFLGLSLRIYLAFEGKDTAPPG